MRPGPQKPLGVYTFRDPMGSGPQELLGGWALRPPKGIVGAFEALLRLSEVTVAIQLNKHD